MIDQTIVNFSIYPGINQKGAHKWPRFVQRTTAGRERILVETTEDINVGDTKNWN